MATTVPDGIWSPDDSTAYNPPVDLAAMADTVQAGLNNVRDGAAYRPGTNAERLALPPGELFDGLRFYATDTGVEWLRAGGAWVQVTKDFPGIFGAVPAGAVVLTRRGYSTLTRNAGSVVTFTYPEAFPTQILGISATTIRDAPMNPVVNSGAISRTSATLVWPGTGAGTVSFSWTIWGY